MLQSKTPRSEETKLFIIDWELSQFGHLSYDIGQMLADLYERKHFHNTEAAIWVIDTFIKGYGRVSKETAFRIAVHTGVHMIAWVIRGPPLHMRPAWATRELIDGIVRLGMTMILRGWEKDQHYLERTFIGGLFRSE